MHDRGAAAIGRAARKSRTEGHRHDEKTNSLLTLSAATFLVACGGNPPPSTLAPQPVTSQLPTTIRLSDERAMELARSYVALLHARGYERLWQHATPEAKQGFGTLDRFRSGGEGVLNDLGAEIAVVSERLEPT